VPSGRRVIGAALRVILGCILAVVVLAAAVALVDVENNSTEDEIAETIYLVIWAFAALGLVGLAIGAFLLARERSR
jgi:hypothetical protein